LHCTRRLALGRAESSAGASAAKVAFWCVLASGFHPIFPKSAYFDPPSTQSALKLIPRLKQFN